MSEQLNRLSDRLPRCLPIGARYVVEGVGGAEGNLRVIARYVLMPDGHRINIAADVPRTRAGRALASRRATLAKRSRPKVRSSAKLAPVGGTARQSER
jgi:hypothetical protein